MQGRTIPNSRDPVPVQPAVERRRQQPCCSRDHIDGKQVCPDAWGHRREGFYLTQRHQMPFSARGRAVVSCGRHG